MNLKIKLLLIFVILVSAGDGFGQDQNEKLKLSVSEAQAYAILNNRSVQSAKIDIKLAEKKVWETIAIGLPQLGLSANYQHQFVIPQLSFGPYLDVNSLPGGGVTLTKDDIVNAYKPSPAVSLGVPDNTTFDFTLSQLIFSGEYLVGLQAMKVLKEVSVKNLVKTEGLTKELVAGTYSLVLVLSESIRVLDESLKVIDKTYNDLMKMNQQGFNEETDVDQIKISQSNIQTLIKSLESQREVSMKLLKFQLGIEFTQNLVLTDTLHGIINQGNIQYLSDQVFDVENTVDYKMVDNLEKISALTLKREQSKYLPTISAFYRRHEQTNQPSFNFQVKDLVGVGLTLPIFTSGQRSAKISQARFDLEKSRLNKETAGQGLILEFETALNNYQTAFSNFSVNRESMILSKKVFDKTVIKYREGVSSSFDIAQSQNQLLTAESNYYTSVLSLLTAKAKLDRILTIN